MQILQARWVSSSASEIIDSSTPIRGVMQKVSKCTEELLDIYSEKTLESGKVIYKRNCKISRGLAHRIGALHTTSHIWIYNSKGEILLQKRSQLVESSPGLYDISVSGHTKSGNSVMAGALLELKQEIGLQVTDTNNLVHIGNYRREVKANIGKYIQHNNEISKVFLLKYDRSISFLTLQENEVERIFFIHISELESDWKNLERLKFYTNKGQEYRQEVLKNLYRVMNLGQ